jgi:epoxyqueuosine reductase
VGTQGIVVCVLKKIEQDVNFETGRSGRAGKREPISQVPWQATGPLEFNPCKSCEEPCRAACPVKSFKHPVYSVEELGQSTLPGLNGTYDRVICNRKMNKDIKDAVMSVPANDKAHEGVLKAIDEFEEGITIKPQGDKPPNYCVKYCRRCELACPLGEHHQDNYQI